MEIKKTINCITFKNRSGEGNEIKNAPKQKKLLHKKKGKTKYVVWPILKILF